MARLWTQLREHYQRRDRLRLIVDYRKKFLDSFVRGGDEEAKQAHLTPTLSPSDAEREKKPGRSRTGIARSGWSSSFSLFRSTLKRELQLAKLTAAINRAKDDGDIGTLREIADDPHGFILRQGWAGLDFSDGAKAGSPHPGPLPIRCGEGKRRLHETLQPEIINVIEALNWLRESPDYEALPTERAEAGRAGGTGGEASAGAGTGECGTGERD